MDGYKRLKRITAGNKQMGNALICALLLPTIGTTRRMREFGMRISTIIARIPTTMWVSGRTTAFSSNLKQRIVEPQGCIIQRYAKSDERPLFGRATEDQRRTGKR